MTIYIFGRDDIAFTCGIGRCDQRGGDTLPFFAFAPAPKIVEALGINDTRSMRYDDDVEKTAQAFHRYGVLVFLDNPDAAEGMMSMLMQTLRKAIGSDWFDRKPDEIGRLQ